ncbi:MAG: 4'-phosphopantetheinyl transferase superfamily protein [Fibrobacter sp.]|nr:4'-phosphopantetheinyl transferase superfamily protein [Fibrobacter sp.]
MAGFVMIEDSSTLACREIKRLDVETPLGVVHLAAFAQKPDHRSVIFGILSDYVGERVSAADLCESKENPRPEFPKLDFDVNWTHSDGYCVCAYGERGSKGRLKIGVDLERYSQKRLHLAERFFSKEEAAQLATLGGESAEAEFFKLWCRKEAFYKCVGGEFFEGTLRRDMQKNPVQVDAPDSKPLEVHFVDLDGTAVGAPTRAALCLAVS